MHYSENMEVFRVQDLQVERNGLGNWDAHILNEWDVFVSEKSLKTIPFPKKNFANGYNWEK